jgi:acetylglutamate kinase
MKMPRFVIEGEWTGYNSSQRRVVHCQIVAAKVAEAAKALHAIVYTDGTSLLIRARQLEPREKVVERNSYGSLIRDAIKHGGSRVLVTDLPD